MKADVKVKHKVLVANRGAIAVRIFRTLRQLNIPSVAVYAEADVESLHVSLADEKIYLGEGSVKETYLNQAKIFEAIRQVGATAVHPGYGFLSENAKFCRALEAEGIIFLGPTPEQMTLFGLKHQARELAKKSEVPLLSGTELLSSVEDAVGAAADIGYPVMLKSTAGGGGIGMQVCNSEQDLGQVWDSITRLSENNFSNGGLFLEKYVSAARHVEVQIFGDGLGQVLILGDRDCSAQRRHQKVIEEAPAPNIPEKVRQALHQTAQRLAESVQYRSAGTVEFIYDQECHAFYFLEMNTRLQVEHGVTECIFDVDLVSWMVQLGIGVLPELESLKENLTCTGHAVQARVYAENPAKSFQPSAGLLTYVSWPESCENTKNRLRIDHWIEAGQTVSPLYDPMLAKVIVHASSREAATEELVLALDQSIVQGIATNIDYVKTVLKTQVFLQALTTTRFLAGFQYEPALFEVLSPGTQTTVQDYPGRLGYWDVGVPPSGPFDSVAFRLGNQLLGNAAEAAGLEMTQQGATLKFFSATEVVITGADVDIYLDELLCARSQVIPVQANQILRIGRVKKFGTRMYMLVKGGIQCEKYLGSRSTFTLGKFGGVTGEALKTGDFLAFQQGLPSCQPTRPLSVVEHTNHWQLRVLYGPHGAPEFFTAQDMQVFFDATCEVHYNSSRTGVRLIGPKPEWARSDGGEAGMHPSNIHDNAYAIGAIDFTGDMPVILGPDGPSLGGFVCPATIISADLWKLGQMRAGDKVSFCLVDLAEAQSILVAQEHDLAHLNTASFSTALKPSLNAALLDPVIARVPKNNDQPDVVYRQSGDANILVEYGPQQLDLTLRFRVHALMLNLQAQLRSSPDLNSQIIDITPGIRSLQLHFDPLQTTQSDMLDVLLKTESRLANLDDITVPSRIVHLPLSWDDAQCRLAVEKYMQSVRKDAPWCPDNIEFIRRINGLKHVDEVKQIVFDASYVVMGLGDVYLGAPVATPVNPKHRLVTTKYNPARTWTAENSVGIGGSYLCVYGMEGPGGYQFVGRTCQMWNRYRETADFSKPWLLRFFDQIHFFEVSSDELAEIRKKLPTGEYELEVEETDFSLKAYQALLSSQKNSIDTFVGQRQKAFDEELKRWRDSGQFYFESEVPELESDLSVDIPDGCETADSPVSGSVWTVDVEAGDKVEAGDTLCVLESMKMEIAVAAVYSGTIEKVLRAQGQAVHSGDALFIIRPGV